jgi:hypothetical protein
MRNLEECWFFQKPSNPIYNSLTASELEITMEMK